MAPKTITLAECQEHMSDKDCWLVIEGKVYDVTPFLDEHPGGFDTLVSNSGKDATEEFEEIGHSRAAKEMLGKYYIGEFAGGAPAKKAAKRPVATGATAGSSTLASLIKALLPILIVLAAVYYVQLQGKLQAA
ncbi:cytochrome b5 [Chlorella sorokiniana]|uniref:Cytochrome b5 n=1 Tax=Chlorella sorokiniana TaxID=3076 RepID=A0A2P6TRY3_CHLSO|nr:cytochrome b5 [Chlorella sorokiniana]|eukprot:PRW56833.1 cytochrome b5 [Chlorella sorokiniana]